jgi:hypothetical protein
MEPYEEVTPCPNCRTRLTLFGQHEPGYDRITRYEVDCPVCRTRVAFVIPVDPEKASLIGYERPLPPRRREATR